MERPELTASPGGPGPRASLSVRLRFLMRDRRFVVALAGAVLVMLVAVGFLAARLGDRSRPILAGASASPSASPSEAQATPSSEPTPSEEPSEEPSATPTPTISASPAPTPAAPPATVAAGGWSIVAEENLNVRDAPGLEASLWTQLDTGWVAYVIGGPTFADGWNWYEVALLGGGRGWVAAGPESDPFLTTLVAEPVLVHCGTIDAPEPDHDSEGVVTIGDVAIPTHLFDPLAGSVLQLEEATGADGCISADGRRDDGPILLPQIGHTACGQPELGTDRAWLRPAAGQDVVPEWKVKSSARILPPLLTGQDIEDDVSGGLRGVFSILAEARAPGCFDAWVNADDAHHRSHHSVYGSACVVVVEQSEARMRLRAASSELIETLYPIVGQSFSNETLPINTPFGANLYAGTFETDSNVHNASVGVTPDPMLSC
jgi:hypothetical protein